MNHYNSQQTQKLCKQLKLEEENLALFKGFYIRKY